MTTSTEPPVPSVSSSTLSNTSSAILAIPGACAARCFPRLVTPTVSLPKTRGRHESLVAPEDLPKEPWCQGGPRQGHVVADMLDESSTGLEHRLLQAPHGSPSKLASSQRISARVLRLATRSSSALRRLEITMDATPTTMAAAHATATASRHIFRRSTLPIVPICAQLPRPPYFRAPNEKALPGFVWVEVKAAAAKVDGRLEVLGVTEPAGRFLDPLDDGVDRAVRHEVVATFGGVPITTRLDTASSKNKRPGVLPP